MRRTLSLLTLAVLLALPGAALAQNRVEQQMFAELRMLQEQMKQLQLSMNTLAEQSKALAAKQDEQANVTRKAFADSKVLTDAITDSIRILREKGDDTNVRIATVANELQAMVQSIQALQTSVLQAMATVAAANTGSAPTDAGTGAAPGQATPATGATPVQSPKVVYQQAYGDYAAGHYDLAIAGFKGYLASFPTSPDAYQAQFQIGESYYAQGKFNLAAQAYREMIDTYKGASLLPDALFKRGMCYGELGMKDQARADFQSVITKFPDNTLAPLAKGRLESIK